MVEKQIQEDRARQLAIMNLGHQYGKEIEAKNELLKAYKQCRDISMDKLREVVQSNYVCVVPDAFAFRLQPKVLLSFQLLGDEASDE
nr:hypothetical protein [Tanacetum cinerariifolium]